MIYDSHSLIPVYRFDLLSQEPSIHHGVTTRMGGVSKDFADSLNLGLGVEDNPEDVIENRKKLAAYMQLPFENLVFQKQTHSTNYTIITRDNCTVPVVDNDALITAEKGIAIATLGADCVPVLLFDKKNNVIAAIHAGWKGTVHGIVDKVVTVMKKEFNTQPQNILAGIGPSICAENYEVGPEVIEAFHQAFTHHEAIVTGYHGDKAYVDLWLANKTWLTLHGVPEKNIEVSGLCTYKNHDTFYSARYNKNRTGRFGGCIVLK